MFEDRFSVSDLHSEQGLIKRHCGLSVEGRVCIFCCSLDAGNQLTVSHQRSPADKTELQIQTNK